MVSWNNPTPAILAPTGEQDVCIRVLTGILCKAINVGFRQKVAIAKQMQEIRQD